MYYVVSLTTQEYGGRAEEQIIGVYSNVENATLALDRLFHKMCDKYGVNELGEYDYYTESDSFQLENLDTTDYVVNGSITECMLDKDNEIE